MIEGDSADNSLKAVVKKSYADHPLVLGPRYQEKDFTIRWANKLCYQASGLQVGGVGPRGGYLAEQLKRANFMRVYEIEATFGRATDNFYSTGRLVEKTTFRHIRRERLERVLSNIQQIYRKEMFSVAGVDMSSQAGYELASRGAFRPASRLTPPTLYGIRTLKLELPEVKFRVQVINENEHFLGELIHKIGLSLRSTACISKLRCTNFGLFNLDHALLTKHWTIENILENIDMCSELTKKEKLQPLEQTLVGPEHFSEANLKEIDSRERERREIVGPYQTERKTRSNDY